MDNCIFCKLANHIFETNIVYEDDLCCVFLDANPSALGHVLVVPKKHYENILQCDDDTLFAMSKAIKIVGNALLETYGIGLNVLSNIKEAAGQVVMHAHIHLIPVNKDGTKANISFASIKEFDANKVKETIKAKI